MKSQPIVILLVVVLFETHNILVTGQPKEKSCRSVVQDLTKMQLGGITACTKRMKFKNGKDKSKKQTCILRCVLIDVGILEQDGQVIQGERVDEFLHKFFPDPIVEQANRTFFPCFDIGVQNKFKSLEEDEFCASYDPFVKVMPLLFFPNLNCIDYNRGIELDHITLKQLMSGAAKDRPINERSSKRPTDQAVHVVCKGLDHYDRAVAANSLKNANCFTLVRRMSKVQIRSLHQQLV